MLPVLFIILYDTECIDPQKTDRELVAHRIASWTTSGTTACLLLVILPLSMIIHTRQCFNPESNRPEVYRPIRQRNFEVSKPGLQALKNEAQ